MSIEDAVRAHYTGADRARLIVDALRAAGLDPDRLSVDDLAPVGEFHIRGREATVELGAALDLRAGQHVLDVGGRSGGVRHLAVNPTNPRGAAEPPYVATTTPSRSRATAGFVPDLGEKLLLLLQFLSMVWCFRPSSQT